MRRYNKDNHNAQLEFVFEEEQDEPPTRRAVYKLARLAGISESHARVALSANGPRRD
jgi:hypothetical protein